MKSCNILCDWIKLYACSYLKSSTYSPSGLLPPFGSIISICDGQQSSWPPTETRYSLLLRLDNQRWSATSSSSDVSSTLDLNNNYGFRIKKQVGGLKDVWMPSMSCHNIFAASMLFINETAGSRSGYACICGSKMSTKLWGSTKKKPLKIYIADNFLNDFMQMCNTRRNLKTFYCLVKFFRNPSRFVTLLFASHNYRVRKPISTILNYHDITWIKPIKIL